MKEDIFLTVIFDPEAIAKTTSKKDKVIYYKNPDTKQKIKIIEKLEKKAAEDCIKFNQRRLSSIFKPVFEGRILFYNDEFNTLPEFNDHDEFIDFAGDFFERLKNHYGIDIIDYSAITLSSKSILKEYAPCVFDFEIFNYSFTTHKAVKTDFVKSFNIKKLNEIARHVISEKKSHSSAKKKRAMTKKEAEVKPKTIKKKSKIDVKGEVQSVEKIKEPKFIEKEEKLKKQPTKKLVPELSKNRMSRKPISKNAVEIESGLADIIPEICEVEYVENEKNIGEQIGLISLSWSRLSPSENIPVLEQGQPVEISGESLVRIYFQKPNVRQIVWRLRQKPEVSTYKPMIRVYKDDDMLWYEVLDGYYGSRYVIFPEDLELSQTWAEIGFVTDDGNFIFVARSPVWPPSCLYKKLPKLKLERKIKDMRNRIFIGATESIPGGKNLPVNINITSSGAGFSASGEGFTGSGKGVK
ncbi:MAG: hypothetical protein EVJ48_07390 [Candidatus Acidulodesulfobacterium acidiphilum]|uniref:Uncharacterized protein n=1 Tax=Candidatus Acidulodesulfobacterium acidiphilum TaxID=2597224 RepID=A0A520XAS3_9DELT|nr:MAG: hypothetical protein EVJ48_07390 [Candidatus Acidulodesulfobacterium acidiphilum]